MAAPAPALALCSSNDDDPDSTHAPRHAPKHAAAAEQKRPGFQQPRVPKSPKQDRVDEVTKVTPEPTAEMHPTTKEWVDQLTAPKDYRDKECTGDINFNFNWTHISSLA